MDDIDAKSKISLINMERTALSHKVDERTPQGERHGYRRGSPDKAPEASAPTGEEDEEERHFIDIIV